MWIIELDETLLSLPPEPVRHRIADPLNCGLVEGGGDLGKPLAFADDQPVDGDRLLAQRKPSEFREDPFESRLKSKRAKHLLIDRKHESADAIGNHRFKESRLGGDQPVQRSCGHPGALGHIPNAGCRIAPCLKLLGRRLDDELPRVLVAAELRACLGASSRFVEFVPSPFSKFMFDTAYIVLILDNDKFPK